jgi:hypothetical protein
MKSRAAPETHPFIEEGFKAREAKQKIAARVAALNSMLEEKPRKRKFETAADFCRQVLWWDSVNQALIKFYETLILKAPSMMTQLRPSASDEYHRVIQEASKLLVIRTDLIDSIESAQRHDQEVIGAMHEARRVEGQLRSHFAAQRIDVNSGTAMEMQKHMRDVVGRLADFRQKLGAAMERIQLMRAKAVTEVAESMAARPDFDAFLCHASEDKAPVVLPFVKVLETAGLRPWLDAAQVGWGDSLVKAVERGLTRSRFVIVFISEAFLRKNWPEKELRSALNMEINGVKKVLPILLGVDHALLQASHPFVAEKLYKIIRPYDPSKPVPEEQLNELVEGLKQELAKLV